MKHNWTKEKMGECAQIFMEQISVRYFDFGLIDKTPREIGNLIKQYNTILGDVQKQCTKTMT